MNILGKDFLDRFVADFSVEALHEGEVLGLVVDGVLQRLEGLHDLGRVLAVSPLALPRRAQVLLGHVVRHVKLLQHLDDKLVVDGVVKLHFLGRVEDGVGSVYKHVLCLSLFLEVLHCFKESFGHVDMGVEFDPHGIDIVDGVPALVDSVDGLVLLLLDLSEQLAEDVSLAHHDLQLGKLLLVCSWLHDKVGHVDKSFDIREQNCLSVDLQITTQ